ncbi:MAG: hypothetical protein GYB31_08505 [Bacteroidetes bacterium]|nr:hypothetical protein [Bacteroidota bacterium]
MKINPIGRYLDTDSEGFLINDCTDRADMPWEEAILAGSAFIRNQWGDQLHSLYIRGSAARNLAVPDISDLDFFAFVKEGEYRWTDPSFDWSELQKNFPFVHGWESPVTTFSPNLFKEYPALAFQVKVHGRLLAGTELANEIAPFLPGPDCCFQYRWLDADIVAFRQNQQNPANIRSLCKLLLRIGMELSIVKGSPYSPDLYFCFEAVKLYLPELEPMMFKALNWFLSPPESPAAFEEYLNEWIPLLNRQLKMLGFETT